MYGTAMVILFYGTECMGMNALFSVGEPGLHGLPGLRGEKVSFWQEEIKQYSCFLTMKINKKDNEICILTQNFKIVF